MDASDWDDRYAAADLVGTAEPNIWVCQLVGRLKAGRAVDIASGEGRNAIWLAARGWQVIASDFSSVALGRAQARADRELLPDARERLVIELADATRPVPGADGDRDLAVLCYLHLPDGQWQSALTAAVDALAPAGLLVVIGHALVNLTEGVGGPQAPAILRDPDQVVGDLAGLPVEVELAEIRGREVVGADRPALDTVVCARRLGSSGRPAGPRPNHGRCGPR